MPVQDGAMGDQEGGEGAMTMGGGWIARGGERGQDGSDAVTGWVVVAVDDKDKDDSGGRRHQATTNPMMATMVAVADSDGDDRRRRQ